MGTVQPGRKTTYTKDHRPYCVVLVAAPIDRPRIDISAKISGAIIGPCQCAIVISFPTGNLKLQLLVNVESEDYF
jgi:hypothetical protein